MDRRGWTRCQRRADGYAWHEHPGAGRCGGDQESDPSDQERFAQCGRLDPDHLRQPELVYPIPRRVAGVLRHKALAGRPRREPTGNLDSRTSVEIMEIFQDLNDKGLTIVLVTHEHDVAQFAKRVIIFRDGRICRDEPALSRPNAREVLKTLPSLED